MPRTPDGKWVDKNGRQFTMHDCVRALHAGITRLTWEVNFGEKTKDDPRKKANYLRDIEILEVIQDSFKSSAKKFVESQKQAVKLKIPGGGDN